MIALNGRMGRRARPWPSHRPATRPARRHRGCRGPCAAGWAPRSARSSPWQREAGESGRAGRRPGAGRGRATSPAPELAGGLAPGAASSDPRPQRPTRAGAGPMADAGGIHGVRWHAPFGAGRTVPGATLPPVPAPRLATPVQKIQRGPPAIAAASRLPGGDTSDIGRRPLRPARRHRQAAAAGSRRPVGDGGIGPAPFAVVRAARIGRPFADTGGPATRPAERRDRPGALPSTPRRRANMASSWVAVAKAKRRDDRGLRPLHVTGRRRCSGSGRL